MRRVHSQTGGCILSIALPLSGGAPVLVRDDVKRTAGLDGHCSGAAVSTVPAGGHAQRKS